MPSQISAKPPVVLSEKRGLVPAGKEVPASGIDALIEIDGSTSTTAASLSKSLGFDPTNMGQILAKLIEAGAVRETTRGTHTGQEILSITDEGKKILNELDRYDNELVMKALEELPETLSQERVLDGVRSYTAALRLQRLEDEVTPAEPWIISSGNRSGLLCRCLETLMRYHSWKVGFGASFESQLATGLGELPNRLDIPKNEA